MELAEYFRDWLRVIDKEELLRVTKWLSTENHRTLCPYYYNIFKAFNSLTLRECKVIMLGLSPYPQKGVATGLAFANKESTTNLSPSLEVIKEACIDYTIPHQSIEFDCTLKSWAKQGVLLLNSALTCRINDPESHLLAWRPFTTKLLRKLSKETTGIIYVLMGKYAQSFSSIIDRRYNDVLECNHPSYYARTGTPMPDVFSEINKLLKGKYNTTIEWYKSNNLNNNENERQRDFSDDFFWPSAL